MRSGVVPTVGGDVWDLPFSADAEPGDATLVDRVLKGDRTAFELLVRRHQGALFRRARWMGLDSDAAADMVQDTLLKAYQSLQSCREPDRFRFWVGQILRNKCLDYFKSADRRTAPLAPAVLADRGNAAPERDLSDVALLLQDALSALPEEQREAFLMKHGEDLSYEEMAEVAGASVSAMKMRVHRAREALRAALGEKL